MEETNTAMDIGALNEKIEKESAFVDILTLEINKVIVHYNSETVFLARKYAKQECIAGSIPPFSTPQFGLKLTKQ